MSPGLRRLSGLHWDDSYKLLPSLMSSSATLESAASRARLVALRCRADLPAGCGDVRLGLSTSGTPCGEGPLRFDRLGASCDSAVDRGPSNTEELGEFGLGVGAEVVQLEQVLGLVRLSLAACRRSGRSPLNFIPSRVRIRIGRIRFRYHGEHVEQQPSHRVA